MCTYVYTVGVSVGVASISEHMATPSQGQDEEQSDPPVFEYGIDSTTSCIELDEFIMRLWKVAMADCKQLFRYSLTDVETRLVPGEYGFVLQRNPKRITHRRRPTAVHSLQQKFNPNIFNFNMINPNEVLFRIKRHVDQKVEWHNVVINVSPIDEGHCLLVPTPQLCLPQVLTCNSLEMCLELISMSCRKGFCVVANSLLAYASVNHLHYHFLYINQPILFDKLIGEPMVNGRFYDIVNHPMQGFGFTVQSTTKDCARDVFRVIKVLLTNNIPHNLVVMKGRGFVGGARDVVKVLLIPKMPANGAKNFTGSEHGIPPFFVAAVEITGFIVVVDQDRFHKLNEVDIICEFTKMSLPPDRFAELRKEIVTLFESETNH